MLRRREILAVVVVALVAAATGVELKRFGARSDCERGELPYHASIRYRGLHWCSGVIISSRHILTSASCVMDMDNIYEAVVVTGSVGIYEGQTHAIKTMMHHAAVNEYSYAGHHDIAIIPLLLPMTFDRYQSSIQLPSAPTPHHSIGVISGWRTKYEPATWGMYLGKAQVKTMTDSECQAKLRENKMKWTHQLCTYRSAADDTCMGDDGAPLVHNRQLIGIMSGKVMCRPGSPYVYTSVYENLEWINYHVVLT